MTDLHNFSQKLRGAGTNLVAPCNTAIRTYVPPKSTPTANGKFWKLIISLIVSPLLVSYLVQ